VNADQVETLIARWPGWVIDHDNKDFYAGLAEQRLLIDRCRACRRWQHPPAPICPACWSRDIEPEAVQGAGTIQLWTVYRVVDPVFGGVDKAGARMVTVELDEQPGLRVTSKFIGPDDPTVGDRVVVRFVDHHGTPFPVFVPDPKPWAP
jgi:uncharacterized OB-fold protein